MRDENLTCSVPEFAAAEQREMEVVLRCRNDVRVGVISVNFTMPYFMWFVSHFTVGYYAVVIIISRFIFDY